MSTDYKTHLYADEDILPPILVQVMKDFESLTVFSVEHYCKVNPICFTYFKMITS